MEKNKKVIIQLVISFFSKNTFLKSDFQNSNFEILLFCIVSIGNLVTFDLSDRPYTLIWQKKVRPDSCSQDLTSLFKTGKIRLFKKSPRNGSLVMHLRLWRNLYNLRTFEQLHGHMYAAIVVHWTKFQQGFVFWGWRKH